MLDKPGHFVLLSRHAALGPLGSVHTSKEVFDFMNSLSHDYRPCIRALAFPGCRLVEISSTRSTSIGIGWYNSDADYNWSVRVTIQGFLENSLKKLIKRPEAAPLYLDSSNSLAKTIAMLSITGRLAEVRDQMESLYGVYMHKVKKSTYSVPNTAKEITCPTN